jgi:hypothetical protein
MDMRSIFIGILSLVGSVAAAILVRMLLRPYVSYALLQATGWWTMMLALYPAVQAFAVRRTEGISSKKRPLTFAGWALLMSLVAVALFFVYTWIIPQEPSGSL